MFKRLSVKITFIISMTTIIVGAIIAGYMQFRIITEIGKHTDLAFKEQVLIMQHAFAEDQLKGVDVSADHINELVNSVNIYDTGFALVQNRDGEFYETNAIIKQLGSGDRNVLTSGATAAAGEPFRINIIGVNYMAATGTLSNGYTVYVLAPVSEVNAELNASLMRFVIIFITAFALVVLISYRVARPIAEPLISLARVMEKVTATGNLRLSSDDLDTINRLSKIPDETGLLVRDTKQFIDYVDSVSEAFEVMASGDLTHEVTLKSENDTIGIALRDMFDNLNSIFDEIHATTAEVTAESKDIADGAQTLASGSVEQAASVEQLSSSVQDIASKTQDNSALASKAAALSDSIRGSAEKGSQQMNDMMTAVGEINDARRQIGQIIKTIDDIAFQTNILALNAAVEAARAGQHGKGFAVVAEEVRNLASKSAAAAKDTGALIQNSIEKAEYGSCIAGETASSLDEIVSGINETTQLVSDIARASEEQSQGIQQINVGIDQVAKVVQLNSATAQQSADVSEKLSMQSGVLEELISQFKTRNSEKNLPRLGK